ncbi:MAG: hypothetical protein JKY43_10570 [Phycisphaerales bacterium]|nr:hypothetical protein [Phycisphaerales bacterium]
MTIGKPSKVINTMKFDQANGKSMAAHTPFVAVILALLALVPMAITEGIGGTIFIILAVGLVGLLYWAMAAIYFRLSVIRLNLAGKKRSYKIDEQMAWSIIGHASSFWILIPASHAVILWIALITSHAEKSHRIDPNSTLNNILGYTVITLFLGSIPTSFVLSELFIFRASRRLRYINHSARPLFSSDTQQLLTKPSPADSPPQKP